MESKLSTEDLNKKYHLLIDDILQKYINDAIDTKKHITYHIEQKEIEPDAEFDPHSDDDIADDSGEPFYEVIVYKASIRLYIQVFNNMFEDEFDKWLLSKVSGTEKNNCSNNIIIDQNKLEIENGNGYNDDYVDNLIKQIKEAISQDSCYPFVIFNIILHFRGSRVTHANTLIIQYSKDRSHILLVYYEPHGSITNIIHDKINIHDILNQIKLKLEDTYVTKSERQPRPKVEITWGVDNCGIQSKDRVGFCRIFTRFWTHITLQLLKLCREDEKNEKNDCLFSKLLPISGEKLLQTKVISQYPNEKDKDYDVIITWIYRMIAEFLSEKNEGNEIKLINEHEEITIFLKNKCINGNIKSNQCSILTEYFTATRFYKEFETNLLNIPKPDNIIEREQYIDKIIKSENDLQLENKLAILKELIHRNEELQKKKIKIIDSSKYLPEIIGGYNTIRYDKDITDNVNIVEEELKILEQNEKIYKENLKIVGKEINLQKNRYKRLNNKWKKIDLEYSNNLKRKNHKDIVINGGEKKKLKQTKTEN